MRAQSHSNHSPQASTRRIVQTSNGTLLLEVDNFIGHLSVTANAFDQDGWEQRSRRLSWIETGFYTRAHDYHAQGGRETLADAIEETALLPRDEAARIATETLLEWEAHIGDAELTESRSATSFVVILGIVVGLFVVAFIALLIVVLVTLVF
jgi:hypothetical protein